MATPRVTVIPVGKVDPAEVEGVLGRVSKILRTPAELREVAPPPKGTENVSRGQHDARALLAQLRGGLARLKATKVIGADPASQPVPATAPEAAVFVTDVDLFAPATEWVFGELDVPHRAALLSVRRLREAFYRRKVDPGKQRARLIKEILRLVARLSGLPECGDPGCALSPTRVVTDIDRKEEHYCAPCWKRLSSGTMRI